MSQIEIAITVDTNDGDYNTEVSEISEEYLETILPLIKAIKQFEPYTTEVNGYKRTHRHNYPVGECCREDLGEKSPRELYDVSDSIFEMFEDILPYNEYGSHTIVSILAYPVPNKTRLL